ncbi:MAG: CHRD domain-containing protein, partial [Solirubrobacterales bacterium]|nr:CHRD domain-containing protein [Solirubrobacterales bacterium]
MRSRLIASSAALLLICLGGCGSSKKSSSTASKSSATPPPATSTTATTKPAASLPSRTYRLTLAGSAETPKGAPAGTGRAVVTLRGKTHQVCWTFAALRGFDKPTFAHVHVGAKGTSGNIVVPLSTGAVFKPKGCVRAAGGLITAIA